MSLRDVDQKSIRTPYLSGKQGCFQFALLPNGFWILRTISDKDSRWDIGGSAGAQLDINLSKINIRISSVIHNQPKILPIIKLYPKLYSSQVLITDEKHISSRIKRSAWDHWMSARDESSEPQSQSRAEWVPDLPPSFQITILTARTYENFPNILGLPIFRIMIRIHSNI